MVILVAMLIAWHTGWQIKKPVDDMTRFSTDMKKSESLQQKKQIVNQMSSSDKFKSINKEYNEMRVA